MKKKHFRSIIILLFIVAAFVLAGCAKKEAPDTSGTHTQPSGPSEQSYYTCPMHPSVRSDKPGACPVCGMALVKKTVARPSSEDELKDLGKVSLSPTQRVVANVSTVPVERRTLQKVLSAVGVVSIAEPNFLHISMRFPGRLERLHLNYTGQKVNVGDPVADVYSPEAISAQQEYLLALNMYESNKNVGVSNSAETLLDLSRQKLLRWGFTQRQIADLEKGRKVQDVVTIHSPVHGTVLKRNVDVQHYAAEGEDLYDVADLSVVWIYLDVYEKDLRYVSVGQPVTIKTEAYPGEVFSGKVVFIEPTLNAETRTVRVRTEFANAAGKLKPNMYANAEIKKQIPNALVVPASAILATGKRTVVWVEGESNTFEPRDVTIGSSTDGTVEITGGVREGEHVAATGGFLIDSESALQQPTTNPHAGHDMNSIGTSKPASEAHSHKVGHSGKKEKEVKVLVKGWYEPEVIRAKRGELLRLHFYRDEDSPCTEELVFEAFNVRKKLAPWKTTTIEITPASAGEFQFACGMDMVHGTLIVEE